MKTSELTGTALNWAVAKCNGKTLHYFVDDWFKKDPWLTVNGIADQPLHSYTPSTDWAQGGAIIEHECIDILCLAGGDDGWQADKYLTNEKVTAYGATPLIAAMRCYVASKLGDEVEVPAELI